MKPEPNIMPKHTILLVDDEAAIRTLLTVALEAAGYNVLQAENAQQAHAMMIDRGPDLVLLDWMMPEVSGIELLRRWRRHAETKDIPVIMLTAKAEEENLVKGLDRGADDYICKPFSPRELVARIKTILRRVDSDADQAPVILGDLVMDTSARSVSINDKPVVLGPTEYRLLEFFLFHQNRAYTRDQLLNNVWGSNVYIDERTIDVHIRRLRKVLAPHGYDGFVQTVRGFGYKLARPDK